MWILNAKRHCIIIISAFCFFGCVTYQSGVSKTRDLLEQGRYTEASENFEKQAQEYQGDRLAYLLEYATALHLSGKYKESNAIFESADKMCDLNDYTSVSREAGAMVVQEGLVQYKAETFEFLLINIYQALNYLLLGDLENAHVKARRLNEKINKIELGKETKKQQTSFAAYLAGLLWEAQGDWDNSYILYNKAYELNPNTQLFQQAVLISSKMARRDETFNKYKAQFPELHKNINWTQLKQQGEFIFILQQGWIPRKRPQRGDRSLPEMESVPAKISTSYAEVEGAKYQSQTVYDLDAIAKKTLSDDMARLVARAIARRASRIAVREASRNNAKNDVLGVAALATVVLDVMDTADLRQWSTLPASFQMIRLPLSPKAYTIRVMPQVGDTPIWEGEVKIQKGRKFIHTVRTF